LYNIDIIMPKKTDKSKINVAVFEYKPPPSTGTPTYIPDDDNDSKKVENKSNLQQNDVNTSTPKLNTKPMNSSVDQLNMNSPRLQGYGQGNGNNSPKPQVFNQGYSNNSPISQGYVQGFGNNSPISQGYVQGFGNNSPISQGYVQGFVNNSPGQQEYNQRNGNNSPRPQVYNQGYGNNSPRPQVFNQGYGNNSPGQQEYNQGNGNNSPRPQVYNQGYGNNSPISQGYNQGFVNNLPGPQDYVPPYPNSLHYKYSSTGYVQPPYHENSYIPSVGSPMMVPRFNTMYEQSNFNGGYPMPFDKHKSYTGYPVHEQNMYNCGSLPNLSAQPNLSTQPNPSGLGINSPNDELNDGTFYKMPVPK